MFDIGWTEMLVIAVVMIVVVGPKDLPKMLRTFGKTTAKLRTMAGDFQKQFNEALKEAELDDVKKSVDALKGLNPTAAIRKQLNPFEKAAADVRAGVDSAMKPKPADPAVATTHAAEPLKNGATEMPGVAGPTAMPDAPTFPAMADPAVPVAGTAVPAEPPVAGAANLDTAAAAMTGTRSSAPAAAKPAAKVASPKKSPAPKPAPAKPAAEERAAPAKAPAKAAAAKPAAAKPAVAKPAPKTTAKPAAKRVAPVAEPKPASRKKPAGPAK